MKLNLAPISQPPYCGIYANSADPAQTPQNVASDQDFHCLRTVCSIKIRKNKDTAQQPLKLKWTGPTDKGRKYHSA